MASLLRAERRPLAASQTYGASSRRSCRLSVLEVAWTVDLSEGQ